MWNERIVSFEEEEKRKKLKELPENKKKGIFVPYKIL